MSTHLALLFALLQDANILSDAERHLTTGNQFVNAGKFIEAYREYRQAVHILDRNPGPELAAALNNLGTTLVALHQYNRALPVLRRATQVARDFLTRDQLAQVQGNTAQVMIRLGLHTAALPIVDEVVSYADANASAYLPSALLSRAAIRIERGDTIHAQQDIERVFQLVQADSPLAAAAHSLRASAFQYRNDHKAAAKEFAIAIEIVNRTPGWQHTAEATDMLESYSISLRKIGNRKMAKTLAAEIKRRKRLDPTP